MYILEGEESGIYILYVVLPWVVHVGHAYPKQDIGTNILLLGGHLHVHYSLMLTQDQPIPC